MQFDKVTINNNMVRTYLLTVKYLGAPHARKLQALGDVLVHQTRDVQHGAATTYGKGFVVVCRLARCLRVNANDLERPKKKRTERVETVSGFRRHGQGRITQAE